MKKFPTLERYNQIIWATIGSGVLIVTIAVGVILLAALTYKLINSHQRGVSVTLIEKQDPGENQQPAVHYHFCEPESAHKANTNTSVS